MQNHMRVHNTLLSLWITTEKLWAFMLKTKDQVLSIFKEFQARAEREYGQKLKVVRTDNGGEYREQFEEYC